MMTNTKNEGPLSPSFLAFLCLSPKANSPCGHLPTAYTYLHLDP